MLPTSPIQTTRISTEEVPQTVRQTSQVLDVLSEFVPGQKLIAQIQFQLANGAYRATIAQRDVTLALPFSAKPGDSLELDVVETEGRIAFAVSRPGEAGKEGTPAASANTTLSRTGQLIARLMQDGNPGEQKPAPLNAGEPVLKSPPTASKELAPALQQAITRSGLFYESHQAAWVGGRLSEAALRQEPQAALLPGPSPSQFGTPMAESTAGKATAAAAPTAGNAAPPPAGGPAGTVGKEIDPASLRETRDDAAPPAASSGDAANAARSRGGALPGELAPLVQQQLSSLASNVYPFQGAIWPGQQIHWEIVDEDGGREPAGQDEAPRQWKTRLKLLLPSLGDIDASVQLDGNDVVVQMKASQAATQSTLKQGVEALRDRLDLAGLRLTGLDVKGYEREDGDGRAG